MTGMAGLALVLVAAAVGKAEAGDPREAPWGEGAESQTGDGRVVILSAMEAEMARSMRELKLKDHGPPYYLAYTVRDLRSRSLTARYGALFEDGERRDRSLYVEARVGSYENDNTGQGPPGFDADIDQSYESPADAPLDDDPAAMRAALWLRTDQQYKQALTQYLKKRGRQVQRVDDPRQPASFSREQPQRWIQEPVPFSFDHEKWARVARAVSRRFGVAPFVFDSSVRVSMEKEVRYFVSSEGGRLVTERVIYAVHVNAVSRAPDGMLLESSRDHYGAKESELPGEEALAEDVQAIVGELAALREAPVIDPYTGPAILGAEATGVLFHEAVGHRLEGERQNDDQEGRTFKGQLGQRILPGFISVIDDPTQAALAGKSLNGHYHFDDEGMKGQKVILVEDGVLKSYLMSRTPVEGVARSNGHGRAQGDRKPQARMANLIVRGKTGISQSKMKEMLLDLAKKQEKPYALIIEDFTGGNTNTSSYGYQAFKGVPRLVYRVDARTGKQELVRGVEMVGTPLTSINKIVALGDAPGVFNGFCGAESGFVPVSTVAPAALTTEIELQRTRRDAGRPPVLSSPFAAEKREP